MFGRLEFTVGLSMRRAFTLLCLLVASAAAQAQPASALSRFFDGVQRFEARFTQVQTDERGLKIAESSGQMALQRPGKFRWQVQQGAAQLIVTDGTTLWLYDEDLQQVTLRSADEALQGSPAALLSQRTALAEAFTVTDEGAENGAQKLLLKPKSTESDFQDLRLWLKDGIPQRMLFRDTLGGATDIRFSSAKTNTPLDSSLFRFTPPQGVEVIDSRTSAEAS